MPPRIMTCRFPLPAGFAIGFALALGPLPGPASAIARQDAPRGADAPARQGDRAEDREAIRGTMEALVRAFNAADAEALAALWTEEGEYLGEDGVTVRGREALGKSFSSFFEDSPGAVAELRPRSLRLLSRGTALEQGDVRIRSGDAAAGPRASYSALIVREDERWRLALLEEVTDDRHSIEELEWLVGEWKSTDPDGAQVSTRYTWIGTRTFLQGRFTIEIDGRTLDGIQVIGVDPLTGGIRSWTFEAEGGVGEADWERDGDHWTFFSEGTLADGASMIATNILRRVDDDTFTLQSIDRALDDEPIPEMPPVKVSRVRAEPSPVAPTPPAAPPEHSERNEQP